MNNNIEITEEEFVILTTESTGDKMIETSFGPSFVSLLDTPNNDWAKQRLKELRKHE